MSKQPDLVVLGAGPAGIGAALSASAAGVDTLVVDRESSGGGQVYRAPPLEFQSANDATEGGDALRAALEASSAHVAFDHRVWCVGRDFRIDALGPDGPVCWRPKAIVLAVGTTERVIPFPGWTLPGVIGLAAATLLLKSQAMLPGERTVVAGAGPLLGAVAGAIVKGGGHVEALVDLSSRGEWASAATSLLARPADLVRGMGWMRDVVRAGTPILSRHAVREVSADGRALRISVAPVDGSGQSRPGGAARTFSADCLAIGNGLVPATEVTRLLGAKHEFDTYTGTWAPCRDREFRTSIDRLYAAGDGAGVTGAQAAQLEGRIAGLTAARDLGYLDDGSYRRLSTPFRRTLRLAALAGRRMAGLMSPRFGQIDGIGAKTVVCRCEDVTRGEIDDAIDRGAVGLDQLKSWTRCGMGPCQGRMCGDTVGAIVGRRIGGREQVGMWSARPPLMALPLEELTGDFAYEDIAIPEAAPL